MNNPDVIEQPQTPATSAPRSGSVRPSKSQVKAAMHWADGWHVNSEMHDDIQAWLPTRKFEDAVCSILAAELKALNSQRSSVAKTQERPEPYE